MLWKEKETWESFRKAYDLIKRIRVKSRTGWRTQFIQAAYAECWVAWKLAKAGYNVKFHEPGCDVSVILHNSEDKSKIVRFEVKHSEDNKDKDRDGHGYSSWVISKAQVDRRKFDFCVLIRDSLRYEEPDAVYVFSREEIASTKPVVVNPPKRDYYLWFSDYFYDIILTRNDWMRMATSPLVESLRDKPKKYQKRWNEILEGKLQDFEL